MEITTITRTMKITQIMDIVIYKMDTKNMAMKKVSLQPSSDAPSSGASFSHSSSPSSFTSPMRICRLNLRVVTRRLLKMVQVPMKVNVKAVSFPKPMPRLELSSQQSNNKLQLLSNQL